MVTYRAKKLDHDVLRRRADRLNDLIEEAVDVLDTATRREQRLSAGDEENRADLTQTYPGLGGTR